MLQKLPPIFPVSELRVQAKDILKQANEQPIVITQNGRPSTVLISYQAYNELIDKVAELESYWQEERQSWSFMSIPSLQRIWDNDQDAAYDNWRELYGVPAR